MNKVSEILKQVYIHDGWHDLPVGTMHKTILEAKQELAKLFHEAVPEQKNVSIMSKTYDYGFNLAIDQTHKNIDEMFK